MNHPRRFLSLGVALLAWLATTSLLGEDLPSVESLRAQIARVEQKYSTHEAVFLTVTFDQQGRQISSSERHLIRTNQRFRHQLLSRVGADGESEVTRQIESGDENSYTRIIPKRLVERYRGVKPQIRQLLPYGPVLLPLGFEGSLSSFLSDGSAIEIITVNVAEIDQELAEIVSAGADARPVMVIRDARFPGRKEIDSTRIAIDLSDDCRLLGAYTVRQDRTTGKTRMDKHIRVHQWIVDEQSFRCELLIESPIVEPTDNPVTTYVRARGEQVQQEYEAEFFRPDQYSGNPRIKDYDGSKLVREQDYYPEEPPPPPTDEGYSPFVKWVIINDVLLGLLVISEIVRYVRRRLRSSSEASTLATSSLGAGDA